MTLRLLNVFRTNSEYLNLPLKKSEGATDNEDGVAHGSHLSPLQIPQETPLLVTQHSDFDIFVADLVWELKQSFTKKQ